MSSERQRDIANYCHTWTSKIETQSFGDKMIKYKDLDAQIELFGRYLEPEIRRQKIEAGQSEIERFMKNNPENLLLLSMIMKYNDAVIESQIIGLSSKMKVVHDHGAALSEMYIKLNSAINKQMFDWVANCSDIKLLKIIGNTTLCSDRSSMVKTIDQGGYSSIEPLPRFRVMTPIKFSLK